MTSCFWTLLGTRRPVRSRSALPDLAAGIASLSLLACQQNATADDDKPTVDRSNAAAHDGAAAIDDASAHDENGAAEPNADPSRSTVKAEGQLGPGRGTLIIDLKAPEGARLTEGAPLRVSAQGQHLSFPESIDTKLSASELPVRLPIDVADGALGPAELELTYYYCTHGDEGSCQPEKARLTVVLDLTGGSAGGEAHFSHTPAI